MKKFLVKCIWHSTAVTLEVFAKDEADALLKASRNLKTKSASSFKVIGSH